MPLEGLKGRRALVTGAASGIGDAVSKKLSSEGVEVFVTDIHPAPGLIVADLTDADDVEKLSAKVGTPDFLINIAGGPVAPSRERTLPDLPKESLALEDVGFDVGRAFELLECPLEPTLADVAPRTDDVGPDLDLHGPGAARRPSAARTLSRVGTRQPT